jgi:AraC family transcriptional regulator, alkane utilization regulator
MTGTPNFMPETPERADAALPCGGADLLSDILGRLRLASAIFVRGEFSAPWAFLSTNAASLAAMLKRDTERLVLFHIVVQGGFRIELASGESARASAGDAVVLPYCDVHWMGEPEDAAPVPLTRLLPSPPWAQLPVIRIDGGGEPTRILCGYLHCEDLLFNPVLRALPRLIHVRPTSAPAAQWREASLRYCVEQAGRESGDAVLARLPELVLVDCLRQYAESLPAHEKGWLAALKDPVLARSLVLLHGQPAESWTVSALAQRVAVSRSVLAERFVQALGVSPMRYLMHWRLQLAADLLRSSSIGLGQLAGRVGYESEAAFSRAFKRHLGVSPASWREKPAPGLQMGRKPLS